MSEGLLAGVLRDVGQEVRRAHAKHGDQSMVSPSVSDGVRLPILVEESGEVALELLAGLGKVGRAMTYDEGDAAALREELVQVAAMAVSWVIAHDADTPPWFDPDERTR